MIILLEDSGIKEFLMKQQFHRLETSLSLCRCICAEFVSVVLVI